MASQATKVEKIETILLSEVFFDPTWNARSVVGDQEGEEGPDDSENSFGMLVKSIKARGQDEPITVRKTPSNVKSKKPWMAVTGHRRGAAIAKIAEADGNKAPTVRVVVKELTELQARSLNLRENTSRNELSSPDVMFGISEMFRLFPDATDSSIAEELGVSQNYVSRLHRIASKVKKNIQDDWRGRLVKLSTEQMDKIGKLAPEEQDEAYKNACNQKDSSGTKKGPDAWKDSNKAASERAGVMLAQLVKTGYVKITDVEGMFDAGEEGGLPVLVTYSKKADEKQLARFAHAAKKAYEKELARVEEEPEATANGAAAQN